MKKKLNRSFYTKPTLDVAKNLLGKYIVRKIGRGKLAGKIIETEAYIGPQDRASHSFGNKRTSRNQAEFLIGGHIYIYLVYGMYWQLNISTSIKDRPECVLVRALEPVLNISEIKNQKSRLSKGFSEQAKIKMTCLAYDPLRSSESEVSKASLPNQNSKFLKTINLTNGPGKLCQWLKLDKSFYGEDLTGSKKIWLEDRGCKISSSQILATGRIGIDYAGHYWSRRKWRFLIKGYERYLSKVK